VSKFIGDGILALFGALEANPWQANDAAHAALAMRRALAGSGRALALGLSHVTGAVSSEPVGC
jgi:class 3 adenylate cyclase